MPEPAAACAAPTAASGPTPARGTCAADTPRSSTPGGGPAGPRPCPDRPPVRRPVAASDRHAPAASATRTADTPPASAPSGHAPGRSSHGRPRPPPAATTDRGTEPSQDQRDTDATLPDPGTPPVTDTLQHHRFCARAVKDNGRDDGPRDGVRHSLARKVVLTAATGLTAYVASEMLDGPLEVPLAEQLVLS